MAEENFDLLKRNPRHPSLHFKRIGKFWSVRAGLDYRALAVQDGPDFILVWIGSHDAYKRLLKLSAESWIQGPQETYPLGRWLCC